MERGFSSQMRQLGLGKGEIFRGEAVLAVAKALLQSGVSYVGGYQGAPVSHLLDVMVSARDFLDEPGVHVEAATSEAAAAAMLGASVSYPVRGAVTWKSIAGSNVASDALSNLASAGVTGGALIVVGEDYGDGASVAQERTYAFAMKSTIWLIDPKPDLATIVNMVEHGFALSEASRAPVFLQLRIRTCHMQGEFNASDNVPPTISARHKLPEPAPFDYERLSHPPVTFGQEADKRNTRIPAACDYIRTHRLNEFIEGRMRGVGIILQGGLYSTVIRQLTMAGLADRYGASQVDMLVLNVTYPLDPQEITKFCKGKSAVLVLEEGYPEFIEQQILQILVHAGATATVRGKDIFTTAGEYTGEAIARGLEAFLKDHGTVAGANAVGALASAIDAAQTAGRAIFPQAPPPRQPTFCTGCPERPVFGAIKLVEREIGRVHVAADIGCHSFATFEPFGMGNSILGYGLSLASAAAVGPIQHRRTLAVMGDGGFWHNGLQSGVAGNLFNKGDGVLLIMENGYTAATGQQAIPGGRNRPGSISIERTLKALGVTWLRRVRTRSVNRMVRALREALTTAKSGLKVIIADGECMLARQRREKSLEVSRIARGLRVETARFGIDANLCTGDHACIRLSGCPALTVAANPDPLRADPVSHITQDCVACGLCGEMAHAAVLCPSFYRAARIHNPGPWDRVLHKVRRAVIGVLGQVA